ncbi:hypothetical protein [Phytohabitans houttuyneae]|uniref:Uncharacterized protein n=1 Tax=Phytohabitans houttuyneae TaxID=1076126 RepID=A0A6V8K8I4_9ACTN|nr:hypothetical protein [Phytohabitans houttuyneae]GFJ78067.1 hypothetical protein Phou_022470 [Phytohabitans houttuyneae]
MDDELTGLEHLLLTGWRQRMDMPRARALAACLLVGLGLGEVADRPVRTYTAEARGRLDRAVHLMCEEPGRSHEGTGRARDVAGWSQPVPSTDRPGSTRSL